MAGIGHGEGGSARLCSKRGRTSGSKPKEPKLKQRGMSIAELERLRIQAQMGASNVSSGSFVPNNIHSVPIYSITSPNQLQEGVKVQNPHFLSQVLPSFSNAPMTAPPLPCHDHQSLKMNIGSEGCDLELRPSTRRLNEEDDYDNLEFRQPNYFTKLLLGEDAEEEMEHKNKKARTHSSGTRSAKARGSSS